MPTTAEKVFQRGSRTYYCSSFFFPPAVRKDVAILYAFVRIADDFVDARPQDAEGFRRFRDNYYRAWRQKEAIGDEVIDRFVDLQERRRFDPQWTKAFLSSMEMDLSKTVYHSLAETLEYIYGSAEVIGLFMSRIMDLPETAYESAARLGRAMQYINFIRDLQEDLQLGRQYLPTASSGLPDLKAETAARCPELFVDFIRTEIERYDQWQREAEAGYRFLPAKCRVPIATAADMYRWTAGKIRANPFVVYERKVKPGKTRILFTGLMNIVRWQTS